jgi:hypothetical protein
MIEISRDLNVDQESRKKWQHILANLSDFPDFLMSKDREKINKYSYPNLWIFAEGGGLETCSGIPGMINEMMLQSHGGVIRIFPVFPDNQTASFYRLRTFGAFLFSGSIHNGTVGCLIIESGKGRECRLQNPWPALPVALYRDGKKSEILKGRELAFSTRPAESIGLVPEGSEYVRLEAFLVDRW